MSSKNADVQIDWEHMAWTSSIAAHAAWDAGYAAAKDQYSGYGIELDDLAEAMAVADGNVWPLVVQSDVAEYRTMARAALDFIQRQADA